MRAPDRFPVLRLPSAPRRRLLKFAAASGLLAAIERNVALAQSAPDYKALVCVNLQGGNDGENTLDPYRHRRLPELCGDSYRGLRHQHSAGATAVRSSRARRSRRTDSIRRVRRCRACSTRRSSRSSRTSACSRKPSTKARPRNGRRAAAREPVLAHRPGARDPERRVHRAASASAGAAASPTGSTAPIPERSFPPLISTMGLRTFVIRPHVGAADRAQQPVFALGQQRRQAISSTTYCATRRCAKCSLQDSRQYLRRPPRSSTREEGLSASSVVLADSAEQGVGRARRCSPNLDYRHQPVSCETIAQLIEGRAQTQMRRQVFYAHQWGYDTHGEPAARPERTARRSCRSAHQGVPGRDGGTGTRQAT